MAQECANIQVAKGPGATLEHRPDFTAGYPAGWKTAGEILAFYPDGSKVVVENFAGF